MFLIFVITDEPKKRYIQIFLQETILSSRKQLQTARERNLVEFNLPRVTGIGNYTLNRLKNITRLLYLPVNQNILQCVIFIFDKIFQL